MRFILIDGVSLLDALSGVGIGFDISMNDLLSWVPDWNHNTHIQILDMQYSAGTQYKARINFDPKCGPIIHLDGLQFDQVKHLRAVHDVDSYMTISENASFMNKWFADAEALARERASDPYHNGEPLLEAFTRTMLGNQASYDTGKRPSAQCHDDCNALRIFYAASKMLTIEKLTIM
jgi:hypothetical protein